jgi:ABC-type nitrate/sulfonate/bicarbonate transport system permease component
MASDVPFLRWLAHISTMGWMRGVAGLIGLAIIGEAVPRSGAVSVRYFPPFSMIMTALIDELQRDSFWMALGNTLESWALGLTIAVCSGALVGIIIGRSALLCEITRSTIEFLRPIPSVALIPLVTLWFGTTLKSNLVLVVYAAFWQVLIQVLYGVQDVDPMARETARSYRLTRWQQIRYVIWPTALPYMMTGIRLAAAVALILTITAELVIGTPGLGKELFVAQTSGAYDVMYVYVLVTGIIGLIVNILARALERAVMPWHASMRTEAL